jgi:hypothetical protein
MSNDQRWQDMTPDEQAVAIRQISGAVNGLQFRVQDLEDAVKVLQERLDKRGDRGRPFLCSPRQQVRGLAPVEASSDAERPTAWLRMQPRSNASPPQIPC